MEVILEIFSTFSWILLDSSNSLLLYLSLFILMPQLKNKLNTILIFIFSAVFSLFDAYINGVSLILVIISYVVLCMSSIDNTNLVKRINIFLTSFIVTTITQGAASFIIINIAKFDFSQNNYKSLIASILLISINYLFSLIIIFAIKKIITSDMITKYLQDSVTEKLILFSIMLVTASYISLTYISKLLNIQLIYLKATLIITILTSFFILISCIILISGHIKELNSKYEVQKAEERNTYIKELERKNNELRIFKHDYKNFLLSLSASLNSKNSDNDSIQELLKYADININSTMNVENENLYHMKDELIRGIILTKLMFAKDKNIRTNFEIDKNPIIPKKLSVEITRILGILLDNAIDACLLTDNPELDFALISFDDHIEFIIKNNISNESTIDLNKIYQTGYTTKAKHGGLGLSTVRKIIDSHSNLFLQTKIDDNFFTIILTILKGN